MSEDVIYCDVCGRPMEGIGAGWGCRVGNRRICGTCAMADEVEDECELREQEEGFREMRKIIQERIKEENQRG